MKYARQRDKNEREIIDALVARGAAVQQLDGAGVPDLLVSFGGQLHLIEVKAHRIDVRKKSVHVGKDGDERGLTPSQSKWWAKWRGKQPVIVHSVDEAIAALDRWTCPRCQLTYGAGSDSAVAHRERGLQHCISCTEQTG